MGTVTGLASISAPLVFAEAKQKIVDHKGDSLVTQLYKSLSEEQQNKICFPIGDGRQDFVGNWWYVSQKNRLHNTLNKDQLELFMLIFNNFHSEEYREPIYKQVVNDSYRGGFNSSSIGFFGKPSDKKFELVFSGHHVTRRCLGNVDSGSGFAGPVFYGHFPDKFVENKDHTGNLFWFQGKTINKFYQILDEQQKKESLVLNEKPRSENKHYPFSFKASGHHGLSTQDMSKKQRENFVNSMREMLAIFRKEDIDATMKLIEKDLKNCHIAFYGGKKYDVGRDKVWDVWSIESPNMVWYFRGQPHIHCYLNVKNNLS